MNKTLCKAMLERTDEIRDEIDSALASDEMQDLRNLAYAFENYAEDVWGMLMSEIRREEIANG